MIQFNPQLGNKRFYTFYKGISPKVSVIAPLNFELAYYDVVLVV